MCVCTFPRVLGNRESGVFVREAGRKEKREGEEWERKVCVKGGILCTPGYDILASGASRSEMVSSETTSPRSRLTATSNAIIADS